MSGKARLIGTAVTLCAALAAPAVFAEETAPELPVAGWLVGSVGLEDFKGQVTALVFFNDSTA